MLEEKVISGHSWLLHCYMAQFNPNSMPIELENPLNLILYEIFFQFHRFFLGSVHRYWGERAIYLICCWHLC